MKRQLNWCLFLCNHTIIILLLWFRLVPLFRLQIVITRSIFVRFWQTRYQNLLRACLTNDTNFTDWSVLRTKIFYSNLCTFSGIPSTVLKWYSFDCNRSILFAGFWDKTDSLTVLLRLTCCHGYAHLEESKFCLVLDTDTRCEELLLLSSNGFRGSLASWGSSYRSGEARGKNVSGNPAHQYQYITVGVNTPSSTR